MRWRRKPASHQATAYSTMRPSRSRRLEVLPLLTTHLSFPGIGAELFLSPHTVTSQAMSIYRKLGASSRHQAVSPSRELGLLEA